MGMGFGVKREVHTKFRRSEAIHKDRRHISIQGEGVTKVWKG
jgi:hypothetical protein